MLKTINTQTTDDPNEFGEILREYCFNERYGCYSCFDLIEGFKEFDGIYLKELLDVYEDESITVYCYKYGELEIAWYWDGDGTLLIKEGNRIAINSDCKKNYTWEWVIK